MSISELIRASRMKGASEMLRSACLNITPRAGIISLECRNGITIGLLVVYTATCKSQDVQSESPLFTVECI